MAGIEWRCHGSRGSHPSWDIAPRRGCRPALDAGGRRSAWVRYLRLEPYVEIYKCVGCRLIISIPDLRTTQGRNSSTAPDVSER